MLNYQVVRVDSSYMIESSKNVGLTGHVNLPCHTRGLNSCVHVTMWRDNILKVI